MNRTVSRCVSKAVFVLSALGLGGCATLDPDGEWRGTPEARLRSCQAMFGPAANPVREQLVAATGAPQTAAPAVGGQCPTPPPSAAQQPTAGVATARAPTPEELGRLVADAERAYGEGRYRETVDLLNGVLAAQPRHASAWLRKANALHRLEQSGEAALAYRQALAHASEASAGGRAPDPALLELRAKASANLAILGVEQAKHALDTLGPADGNPVAAAHRSRIEAALRAVVGASPEASPGGAMAPQGASPALQASRAPRSVVPAVTATTASTLLAASPGVVTDATTQPSAAQAAPAVEVIRGLVPR